MGNETRRIGVSRFSITWFSMEEVTIKINRTYTERGNKGLKHKLMVQCIERGSISWQTEKNYCDCPVS
ncbi:protein of unknown function [Maridesulfovibrio hydrothermalis AM13 = DSM 14728]|uniref:Uncharacterized protein n=1 Tax=Maridesulfovibrio hydrothermalis AM13 = DSM 14728 TaxID=1121451 RepID=L0RDR6_9BACT|nr:protein of unknown function [Maridesulfovibrio hydrothermalis AM13 = DSM 14728]